MSTLTDEELVEQMHTYSDPHRDPRQHTISTVFIARAAGMPVGGDDAKQARVFTRDNLPPLVFDHARIIADYFSFQDRKKSC